jgi:uncharacterized protein DUF1488
MFFTFPEDARWNEDRQSVEFGVQVGEHAGVVRVRRQVFGRFLDGVVTPERCVDAYHLERTRFERIAERKLAAREWRTTQHRNQRPGFARSAKRWVTVCRPMRESSTGFGATLTR